MKNWLVERFVYCTLLLMMIPNCFLNCSRSKSLAAIASYKKISSWWIQPGKTTGNGKKGKNWTVPATQVARAAASYRCWTFVACPPRYGLKKAGGCRLLCCCCFEVLKCIWTHRSIRGIHECQKQGRYSCGYCHAGAFHTRRRFPHRCPQHGSAVLYKCNSDIASAPPDSSAS